MLFDPRPNKEERSAWSEFVTCTLVALAAAAYVLCIPFLPLVAWWERHKRKLLTAGMTARNRVMPWPDFVRAAKEKRGTLIIEGDPRKGPNLWWTPEDLSAVSPHSCSLDLRTLLDRTYQPFRFWCYERYTSPSTGSASLVVGGEGQNREFAIGSDEPDRGTGIFQDLPTVLISYHGRR